MTFKKVEKKANSNHEKNKQEEPKFGKKCLN